MKILSVGSFLKHSNTCLHRHWALTKLADQIDQVELRGTQSSCIYRVANRLFQKYNLPISLPDEYHSNKNIKILIQRNSYDLIWIDKGLTINASTLIYIKHLQPNAKIISFAADNMALRISQSNNFLKCIPLYDYHVTTKSYAVEDLKKLGARNVIFTNQSYEPSFHYPRQIDVNECQDLGGDVGFIGRWEKERCQSILYLVQNGIKVKVYGGGRWLNYKNYNPNLIIKPAIFSEDYSKALQTFKISLCFLSKLVNDLQTSRTMEIPACGGFMLAERTSEHLKLFKEGFEAEFFSNDKELLEKCRYYLKNERKRKSIVGNGIKRCEKAGYSNIDTLKRIISRL